MSSGQLKVYRPKSKTIIKDGKIVRINKDGSIRAVLGPYPPEKSK